MQDLGTFPWTSWRRLLRSPTVFRYSLKALCTHFFSPNFCSFVIVIVVLNAHIAWNVTPSCTLLKVQKLLLKFYHTLSPSTWKEFFLQRPYMNLENWCNLANFPPESISRHWHLDLDNNDKYQYRSLQEKMN